MISKVLKFWKEGYMETKWFYPTIGNSWIQEKIPSRFETEMTIVFQNPIRSIPFLPNHDMFKKMIHLL